MCSDAQMARDMARTELSRQEQSMAESRREREKVLSEYRKQAEEKKEFADKVERRVSSLWTCPSMYQFPDGLILTQLPYPNPP